MEKEIIYIDSAQKLNSVHVGDYGYYEGHFFNVTRLLPRLAKSETCPCVSKSCTFNDKYRMHQEGGKPCLLHRFCISVWREDHDSVIFTEYTPTAEELASFSQWCATNNIPFSYEQKTD